jgi:hypothetical protein
MALMAQSGIVKGLIDVGDGTAGRVKESPAEDPRDSALGRALLGVLPIIVVSSDQQMLGRSLEVGLQGIARENVILRSGGSGAIYGNYQAALMAMRAEWQSIAMLEHPEIITKTQEAQTRTLTEYHEGLRQRRIYSPHAIPFYARSQVRSHMRAKVPTLPRDWAPWDQRTLMESVHILVANRIRREGIVIEGARVRPTMSFDQFLALAPIQKSIRERLELPESVRLRASYANMAQFEKEVFSAFISAKVRQEISGVSGDAGAYAEGGGRRRQGEHAARAVVAPAFALGFSLAGAITHTIKLAVLIAGLLAIYPAISARTRVAQAAVAAVVSMGLVAGVAHAFPRAAGTASLARESMFWSTVAAGQAASYPVNEWVRRKVLGGFAFGVLASQKH